MSEIRFGGRCDRHPLNILPCQKCAEEAKAAPPEGLPYGIVDPDYARIYTQARIIAWQYGFACVMHGSFTRDLDLLMVPWEDRAWDAIVLPVVNRIADACGLTVKGEPKDKPHGRKAYTLLFPGKDPRWVDVSVMPCAVPNSAEQPAG